MNQLVEQVVKKKKDSRYYINVLLILLATVGIPGTFLGLGLFFQRAYLAIIAVFSLFFCIYGAWFFISSLNIDYEYACLQSVLRFDKIISKRRRKPIVKLDIKSITDFFPYSDEEMSKRKISKVYYACADEYSEENYVAAFKNEARGQCVVIFTPNEKMLKAIEPYFSVEIKKKRLLEQKS